MCLRDLIYTAPDSLPAQLCDDLVEGFKYSGKAQPSVYEGVRDFRELLINTDPCFSVEMPIVWERFMYEAQRYAWERQIPEQQLGLESCDAEGFRIKHYAQGKGSFLKHVDVGDHASARRALAVFWYLNDVQDGGETVFYAQSGEVILSIKPEKGRIVVFPPMWMFPHAGLVPLSGDKYLLSSYLHYR